MSTSEIIIATGLIAFIILFAAWIMEYGLLRGTLAIMARLVWLLPLLLAFLPETRSENVPRTLALKTIHVLLDDSQSMEKNQLENTSLLQHGERIIATLNEDCLRLGCLPKVTRLSELSQATKEGFTPLSTSILPWFYSTAGDAWTIISDGGDSHPGEGWDAKLKGVGRGQGLARGLIVGFKPEGHRNIWIETPDSPLFSFIDKPLQVNAILKRQRPDLPRETTQVQILTEDKAIATLNATFEAGEDAVEISTLIPPLGRGQHLIALKALPAGDETATWDNLTYKIVEVLPNTVGILHLLGAPSWDGRFLRRYLKSEPKYDLISFFILRDPGDMQLVNERELSLIPFPVDRLFNEELPNFHAVVIQNFALYQFLEPAYQINLVRFVQNGGGLLFVGGPRALQAGDYANSPLASILPFIPKGESAAGSTTPLFGGLPAVVNKSSPYYDENLAFKVELAAPSPTQRSLANVFDDWEQLAGPLASQKGLRGLHHMENVEFKKEEYTPLLTANLENGQKLPLAVASYPGKGRALWIFSDDLWRMALTPSANSSREVYHDFMKAAMTWLLRQEMKKSLLLKNLKLSVGPHGTQWMVNMLGPAARYFKNDDSWKLEVCQTQVNLEQIFSEEVGPESWMLSGRLPHRMAGGTRCTAKVTGNHSAFGSVQSSVATVVPAVYGDQEVFAAPHKLEELARLTEAPLLYDGIANEVYHEWIGGITGNQGVALPSRYKTIQDFYWVLDRWWFWLVLFFLPLEIVARRWPQLTAIRKKSMTKNPDSSQEARQGLTLQEY